MVFLTLIPLLDAGSRVFPFWLQDVEMILI